MGVYQNIKTGECIVLESPCKGWRKISNGLNANGLKPSTKYSNIR